MNTQRRRSNVLAAVLLSALLAASLLATARSGGGGHSAGHFGTHTSARHSSGSHATGSKSSSRAPGSGGGDHRKAQGVARDSHGKIARSEKAKDQFKKSHPCPSTGRSSGTCPGYVIDHITPLKRGGADAPYNMQWQTTAAAKAKDRTE